MNPKLKEFYEDRRPFEEKLLAVMENNEAVRSRYVQELEEEKNRYLSRLRNLLAVIHGDGGQYLGKHGFEKTQEDAIGLILKWRDAYEVSEL